MPWTRVFLVGLVCFGLWFLLDAPSLQTVRPGVPIGTRRTVSMDVTGPVAALSRTLGLDNVVGWVDEALGRTPGGGPSLAAPVRRLRPLPLPTWCLRPDHHAHHPAAARPPPDGGRARCGC